MPARYSWQRMFFKARNLLPRSLAGRTFRRRIGVLLLVACLPSLLMNMGMGRSMVVHGHDDQSYHAHVVYLAAGDHHHHWHGDLHEHEGAEDSDSAETDADDAHGDALIRGAEATAAKKESSEQIAIAAATLIPSLLSSLSILDSAPVADRPHGVSAGGAGRSCLRAVILLI